MRMDFDEVVDRHGNHLIRTVIILSERNVRALYHKLTMDGSQRTIEAPDRAFIVTIEDDATHYADRAPGVMHPETEAFINESEWVADAERYLRDTFAEKSDSAVAGNGQKE